MYKGNEPRIPWTWFERVFGERYLDMVSGESLRRKFVNLTQGNGTVRYYNVRFDNLMRYAPDIVADDSRLRQQYLGGLNPKFAQLIDQPGTVGLPNLIRHALQVETYEPNRAGLTHVFFFPLGRLPMLIIPKVPISNGRVS